MMLIKNLCSKSIECAMLFISFIALSSFAEPRSVQIASLMHKITRAQLDTLIGQPPVSDSIVVNDRKASPVHQILYRPVMFEGQSSRVMAVVADDSVLMYSINIP